MNPVSSLDVGVPARLARIDGDAGYRRRLMEMGFLPGTPVRVIRRVGIGGVLEVEVRSCRVSLRNGEAGAIFVEPLGDGPAT